MNGSVGGTRQRGATQGANNTPLSLQEFVTYAANAPPTLEILGHGPRSALRFPQSQADFERVTDGRPIDWQSPEAKPVNSAMCVLAKSLGGGQARMTVPLPLSK
jgi:hypothetical protein